MTETKTSVIVLTGVESSGKTTLARGLASHFNCTWLPEYSRIYMTGPGYDRSDLVAMTEEQYARELDIIAAEPERVVLDTDMTVMKVWWQEVFGDIPSVVLQALESYSERRYLLPAIDIPWEPDPIRIGTRDRQRLFDEYLETLTEFELDFRIVRGRGEERFNNAVTAIDELAEDGD